MFTGHSVIAACLLLLYTQGSAATISTRDASRGSQRQEDMHTSAAEVIQGQDSRLGDTAAASQADPADPGLSMEPLPEDYTATQERKVSSTFWQVLQQRRMKALLACETTLWELMGQNVNDTYKKNSPREVEDIAVNISIIQLIVDFFARLRSVVCHCFLSGRLTYTVSLHPKQTQAAGDMIPDTEGRRTVDKTEAEIEKCYREISLRAGQADPQVEIRENLLREIDHIVDQVEACRAAGGMWPSADRTQSKLGKVKLQSDKSIAHSEMLSILESSLARVLLDKQLCLETLPLPANQYIALE